MSTPRRQTTLRSRVQTAATVSLAIYGAYKLGEWVVGAIRESTKVKDEEADEEQEVPFPTSTSRVLPPPPCLNRETQQKLQRHHKIACARDALALMQRMAPVLDEAIVGRTGIATERHELKRLRGDTTNSKRQQALWRDIQNKTLLRLFMTMQAESMLFTVTWLHIHWVAATSTLGPTARLSRFQTSTLFRTLFNTILSFLDTLERQCHDAIIQHTNEWDTHSDLALHMTYAKFKGGLDNCIADIFIDNSSDENKNDVWLNYVAALEREFGAMDNAKDAAVAELLDLLESPLAKEAFPALFQALFADNSVRNVQQVFASQGELPLAQVIAKLSKQSFSHSDKLDRLVGLPHVNRISQLFFPEDR